MKLKPLALALAGGIFWGLGLFVMTAVALLFGGYLQPLLENWVGIYPWYSITWLGAVIGAVEGFIDGFVACLIFAWLYNAFVGKKQA